MENSAKSGIIGVWGLRAGTGQALDLHFANITDRRFRDTEVPVAVQRQLQSSYVLTSATMADHLGYTFCDRDFVLLGFSRYASFWP